MLSKMKAVIILMWRPGGSGYASLNSHSESKRVKYFVAVISPPLNACSIHWALWTLDVEPLTLSDMPIVATLWVEEVREVGLWCQMIKTRGFDPCMYWSCFVPRIHACDALRTSSKYNGCLCCSIVGSLALIFWDFPNNHFEDKWMSGARVRTRSV